MKIRWREHEIMAVSILVAIKIAGYIWNMYSLTAGEIERFYASAYSKQAVPFQYFTNILLPQTGILLVVYVCYLWINRFIVPLPQKVWKNEKAYAFAATIGWIALQLLVISYIFALGVNIASYYAQPHLLNYGPGFRILSLLGYNDEPLVNLFAGFGRALSLMMIYMVLAGIRECLIYFIEKSDTRRNYRIIISNQFTALLVIYFSIAAFVSVFNLVDDASLIAYLCFVPLVFLVYLINTYWLFPAGETIVTDFQINSQRAGMINNRLIIRLVISALICTLPFAVLFVKAAYHENFLLVYFGWWSFQLFIVTPLSWVLYTQRKDKIRQLRGVEKELVQSKAHLQFLRSQINPHFLFNALNTLYGTALLESSERTAEGIQKLGDMMRFMLHENNQEAIPMSREIEYLKNYIALQKLRTQSSSQISIEDFIDEKHCSHQIAPMLLIPFVENAFKHGISLKEKSWIKIKLYCDNEHIHFEVRNSMHAQQKNDPEKDKSGVGLKNVIERLMLLYEGRHQFNIQTDSGEYVVQLSIQPKALASMASVNS